MFPDAWILQLSRLLIFGLVSQHVNIIQRNVEFVNTGR
jgi:hypothetical protein